MSDVTCGLSPESTVAVRNLTVGDLFKMRCQGEWPGLVIGQPVAVKEWEIRADENNFPFVLKLLKIEKIADDVVELELASYRVGPHDLKAVQLVSSDRAVLLGDLQFSVNSVQNPKEPVTEPFGAWPPLALAFPWLFVVLLVGFGVLALALALRPRWLRKRNEKWMAEVPPVRSATPEQELYRILRVSTKLEEFDQGFRFYLARKFGIPAHRMSTGKILKSLKRAHGGFYERHGELVRETLVELRRAEGLGSTITENDIEGLRVRVRKILAAVDAEMARKRGRA